MPDSYWGFPESLPAAAGSGYWAPSPGSCWGLSCPRFRGEGCQALTAGVALAAGAGDSTDGKLAGEYGEGVEVRLVALVKTATTLSFIAEVAAAVWKTSVGVVKT
eukprot:762949-Hanusia_phi.AAC.15